MVNLAKYQDAKKLEVSCMTDNLSKKMQLADNMKK